MTFRRNPLLSLARISLPPFFSFFLFYTTTPSAVSSDGKNDDSGDDLILHTNARARLSHTAYVSLISTTHKINDTSIMTLPVFVNHFSRIIKKRGGGGK